VFGHYKPGGKTPQMRQGSTTFNIFLYIHKRWIREDELAYLANLD